MNRDPAGYPARMFAVIAAILFGLALLLELLKTNLGGLSNQVLEVAGLFALACHFAASQGLRRRLRR